MSKQVIEPFKSLDAVDISTNQVSPKESNIQRIDNVGVIVTWSGTSPVGTLFVDCASYDTKRGISSNWQTLDFGSDIAISGNSGSHTISINQNPFSQLRLRYVATSGIGTLSAVITGKSLGV